MKFFERDDLELITSEMTNGMAIKKFNIIEECSLEFMEKLIWRNFIVHKIYLYVSLKCILF